MSRRFKNSAILKGMHIQCMTGNNAPWPVDFGIDCDELFRYNREAYVAATSIPYFAVRLNVVIRGFPALVGGMAGIDIPVLLSKGVKKKDVIVIVGEAPQRNNRDFSRNNARIADHALLGTPYAAHYAPFRESKRGKIYWDIILSLLQTHDVYLTDYYKVYTSNGPSYGNNEVIRKEIDTLKPVAVVAFGDKAAKSLGLCYQLSRTVVSEVEPYPGRRGPIPFIPLIHPSRRVKDKLRQDFFKNNSIKCSNCDIATKYVELIKKSLKR